MALDPVELAVLILDLLLRQRPDATVRLGAAVSIRSRSQTKSQFTSNRWLSPRSAFRTETYCISARWSSRSDLGMHAHEPLDLRVHLGALLAAQQLALERTSAAPP